MDRGAWQATVHGVAKSQTWLSDFHYSLTWTFGSFKGCHAYVGPLTCLFQDTVVALHALSRYGAATFTRTSKAAQVTIKSSGTFSTKFQVENSNRLLLQQVSLPEVPGEYSMSVTGEGCVYLQVRFWGQKVQSHHGHWKVLTQWAMAQMRERVEVSGRSPGEGKITDFSLFHRHLWNTIFSWKKTSSHLLWRCRLCLKLVMDPKPTLASRFHWMSGKTSNCIM